MKQLLEIGKIVTKKKVRKIEIFDEHSLKNSTSKFSEFYEALQNRKFKNDRDAASYLYGSTPKDDKYRQLKSRFKKRLLNTLFFLDVNQPSASGYDNAYYSCNKDWTLVRILQNNEAHFTAESLSKQILSTAFKFQFSDVIVNCARILRSYAAQSTDQKAFEEYNALILEYEPILANELKAEQLAQELFIRYKTYDFATQEGLQEIIDLSEALIVLSEQFSSPVIYFSMFMSFAYRFELQGDYETVIQICDEAQKYLTENPQFTQTVKLNEINLKRMYSYLHLRNFKDGRSHAEQALINLSAGTTEWFDFMEVYLLLGLRTKNYVNAIAVFNTTVKNTRFKKLNYAIKERWILFESFLIAIAKVESASQPMLMQQLSSRIRSVRVSNDMSSYPKDLRLFYFYQLVAHILQDCADEKYDDAKAKIDQLRSVGNRLIKKEKQFRAYNFIRLLNQTAKVNFVTADLSNTEKYIDGILTTPWQYRGFLDELEVVSYEQLWALFQKAIKP